MSPEAVLSIVGSFLVLGLGINGFFLRGIFNDLNDVKINMATIIAHSKNKEKRIEDLEEYVKENEKEKANLRDKIHTLEGAYSSFKHYIEINE